MPTRTLSISFTISVTALIFLLYAPIIWPAGVRAKQSTLVTAMGVNTLSCSLNNTRWEETSVRSALSLEGEVFYLSFWVGDQYRDRIAFVMNTHGIKPGTYEFNDPTERYILIEHHSKSCVYQTDGYYTGTLTITAFDTSKKIIAGSFEVMAYSNNCQELLKVSEGAFDVQYSGY